MNSALDRSLPPASALTSTTTLLASLLATAVLLTGCGDAVLDFRNAEISNGNIYKAGADAAFTGTVTNIPQAKLLSSQPGLSQVNRTLRATLADNFEFDRQLLTQSLCDVKVKKGAPHGEAVCKLPRSETLHSRLTFEDGALEGPYTRYDLTPANHVLITASFKEGVPDGQQELFNAKTQKLATRLPWKAGKLEGEDMRWGADGKMVIYRATLVEGNQDGVEEEFYPDTGKPARRTEWNRGKKNGRLQEWDTQWTASSRKSG